MKIKLIFGVIALTFIIITPILTGCSFDKLVEVAEGDYIPVNAETRGHDDSGISLIESINVDRDRDTVEVRLMDGAIINVSFNARPKAEWPSGCPANLGSTKMEVLDLMVEDLAISHIILKSPVLVRNCPQDPEKVILREDGHIGGSGTACAGNDRCIHFKPGTPSEPLQRPRELTAEEEDRVFQIALDSSEVETLMEDGDSFTTDLRWVAMLSDKLMSGFWQIDYDWQADDEFKSVPEQAVWYPGVLIRFGEPEKWQALVAIDLESERAIFVQQNPYRSGPATPHEEPDIVGQITDTQISSSNDTSGRILVELEQSDRTSDKYWVAIKPDTIINDYRGETQHVAGFNDLEVDQHIQVWFHGSVRESYPAQVNAGRIDIVNPDEGFAIYFLEENILPSEMLILSHVVLPEAPIVSINDIISYSKMTHEMKLTPKAYARIQNIEVPRVFIVTVGCQPIYWGTFWAPWFSRSIDGVVILKPLSQDEQIIQINLGYPSGMGFTGDDPRSDPILIHSLERNGKLSTVVGQHVPIEEVEIVD
jgi:hypothetical protein